jgi:hypothetical protein
MATALPGPSSGTAKFLLWRTDRGSMPSDMLSQDFVTGLDGMDTDGSTLTNSACIVEVGGEDADLFGGGTVTLLSNQKHLLPDALCFVEDGLLFLMQGQLDHVFGFSLEDGHLSAVQLAGVNATGGFYIPNQDVLRGYSAPTQQGAQFAFAGDEPEANEEGPDTVAFVAGSNAAFEEFSDLSGQVRDGYGQEGNRTKDLFTLQLATDTVTGTGLDLAHASSTLQNLSEGSGSTADDNIRGDLLTPGRLGEQLCFLAVSPDGEYVGVVRDYDTEEFDYYGNYIFNHSFGYWSTGAYYGGTGMSNDDVMLFAVDQTEDLDSSKTGTQNVIYMGTRKYNGTSAASGMPTRATSVNTFNAYFRRITDLQFSPNQADNREKSLIVTYAGNNSYHTKYYSGYQLNPYYEGSTSTYYTSGAEIKARIQFKTNSGGRINPSSINGYAQNLLEGLSDTGKLGDLSAPFGFVNSDQYFWSTFRSENGSFLYFVSDQFRARNYIVGVNITPSAIGTHDPFEAFHVHATSVGMEQIDVNSWNYENRFASVPGSGIVCFVANDMSAGAENSEDLEVYAFDANAGGTAVVLTSDVTPGSRNSLNHLYLSTNSDVLVFQRTPWVGSTYGSGDNRTVLQGDNDLCVVTNVLAAVGGATPDARVISAGQSHGHSIAFLGEGLISGPKGVLFSSTDPGTNESWDDRTLKLGLIEGASISEVDKTASFYEVLAADRKLDDDATTGQ